MKIDLAIVKKSVDRKRALIAIAIVLTLFSLIATGVSAACTIPSDGLTLIANTTLCSGTYYLDDVGGNGLIILDSTDMTITCNGTTLIGQGNGYAFNNPSFGDDGVTIQGCSISNYSTGIYFAASSHYASFYNLSIWNNTVNGIYVKGNGANFTDVRVWNHSYTASETGVGIHLDASSGSVFTDCTANYNYFGYLLEDSSDTILYNITAINNTNRGLYIYQTDTTNVTKSFFANNSNYIECVEPLEVGSNKKKLYVFKYTLPKSDTIN